MMDLRFSKLKTRSVRRNEYTATYMQLTRIIVPSEMTREIFWKRFFFRMHQIDHEEERRKILIECEYRQPLWVDIHNNTVSSHCRQWGRRLELGRGR
jgi:hypothetical protein